MERPPTDLGWYAEQARHLMTELGAPPCEDVLVGESVEYGAGGIPRKLGDLFGIDEYRARFADLTSRGLGWINLHAVGVLGTHLVLSIEAPTLPQGSAGWTSVNLSGPTRAMIDRGFDLQGVVED